MPSGRDHGALSRRSFLRVGIVSINPAVARNATELDFKALYQAVGMNTGNLMFATAMYRQLDAEVKQIGFSFDSAVVNENFDAVVIPAANWLNQKDDWDWLTALIEQLEIPVVTIGIGLQANTTDLNDIRINASCQRLIRVLSTKAPFISTRGFLTTRYLQSIGVMNVVTTGCPSIYMPLMAADAVEASGSPTVIQSTRYYYSSEAAQDGGLNNALFAASGRNSYDMVYQSEPEEMEYLLKPSSDNALETPRLASLARLYGLANMEELKSYLDRCGKVFLDLDQWSAYLQTKERVLGTRLHGAIIALNSGTPAILLAHDSRTTEMIDFAGIPTVAPEIFGGDFSPAKINAAFAGVDMESYRARRESNRKIYKQFLLANGLTGLAS